MSAITKIVIKGSSGYGPSYTAYNDKLVITDNAISYEYKPYIESEMNFTRKWSYKTNGAVYRDIFMQVAVLTEKSLKQEVTDHYTDIGVIIFEVTYADGKKAKETYWLPGDYFSELFGVIKELVPRTECIPEVLKTEEDYED